MENYDDIYWSKYYAQDGLCYYCKKPLHTEGKGQLAHRVIKSKHNIKKYGLEIIDHPINLRLTCAGCNSRAILDKKTKKKDEVIKKIKKII